MIVKGIVSAIFDDGSAEVILVELDRAVTPRIMRYGSAQSFAGEFVLVVVFSDNFADAMIL